MTLPKLSVATRTTGVSDAPGNPETPRITLLVRMATDGEACPPGLKIRVSAVRFRPRPPTSRREISNIWVRPGTVHAFRAGLTGPNAGRSLCSTEQLRNDPTEAMRLPSASRAFVLPWRGVGPCFPRMVQLMIVAGEVRGDRMRQET